MPLYEYRCTQCGHHFEKIQSFNSTPEVECPKCHGVLERPLNAPRLNFKGEGWYVNDYAPKSASSASGESGSGSPEKNSSKEGTGSAPAAPSADSKPAAATESAAKPATPAASA